MTRKVRWVSVLTGVGISAESCVPTFRGGHGGLWRTHCTKDLATLRAYCWDPKLEWEWKNLRGRLGGDCRPNATQHTLTDLPYRFHLASETPQQPLAP